VIRDEPPVLALLASICEADHAGKGSLALFRTEQDEEILQLFFAAPESGALTPTARAAGKCRPLAEEIHF